METKKFAALSMLAKTSAATDAESAHPCGLESPRRR
jgi:hypothetical protein